MRNQKILFSSALLFICTSSFVLAQERPVLDVPYVATRTVVVDAMLKLAGVKAGDVLYDLGCGDGRIVIDAAKNFGATGSGFDLDLQRILEANENAKNAGVTDKVKFIVANLFDIDLRKASVITLYLLPGINMKLRPRLMALKPGTRIVSHAFDLGDWEPDKSIFVDGATLYLWTIPSR